MKSVRTPHSICWASARRWIRRKQQPCSSKHSHTKMDTVARSDLPPWHNPMDISISGLDLSLWYDEIAFFWNFLFLVVKWVCWLAFYFHCSHGPMVGTRVLAALVEDLIPLSRQNTTIRPIVAMKNHTVVSMALTVLPTTILVAVIPSGVVASVSVCYRLSLEF